MKVVISLRRPPAWVVALAGPAGRVREENLLERREPLASRLERVPYYAGGGSQRSTPIADWYAKRTQFELPKTAALRPGFRAPMESRAITIVGAPLSPRKGVTVLQAEQWQRLHLSRAEMLAATPTILRQVVACVECSLMALPRLADAIVVLNSVEQGWLGRDEREMLWRTFGLPVFEQWLGLEGELLAWECVTHQGLHLNTNSADFEWRDGQLLVTSLVARRWITRRLETGWTGEVVAEKCPCGHDAPKLRNVRAWNSRQRAAAAVA
ncbi:MAG: hypothetical protein NW208_11270 [Bryobacter sp.]|nr:hypothetical protein [Bryobacter sp.]